AHDTRARGARTAPDWLHERRDRRAAVHLGQDRRAPREPDPQQARRAVPGRGRGADRHGDGPGTRIGGAIGGSPDVPAGPMTDAGHARLWAPRPRQQRHDQEDSVETTVTEIAPDIFRLSTFVPEVGPTGFTFNQFVVRDDEPF